MVTKGTFYRSPLNNSILHSSFADSLTSKFKESYYNLGDLNYNLLEFDNPHVNNFIQIMHEHKFYPTINKLTKITTNNSTFIDDHIWTDISNGKISCRVLIDCIAYHLLILQCVQLKPTPVKNAMTAKRHIPIY